MSTTDTDVNELDALADLVNSEGWAVFLAHVEAEYGAEAYAREMDTLVMAARAEDRSPEVDICALAAVVRKVQALKNWPAARLADLKAKKAAKPEGGFGWRRRA